MLTNDRAERTYDVTFAHAIFICLGWHDALHGKVFSKYDSWPPGHQLNYELGRLAVKTAKANNLSLDFYLSDKEDDFVGLPSNVKKALLYTYYVDENYPTYRSKVLNEEVQISL